MNTATAPQPESAESNQASSGLEHSQAGIVLGNVTLRAGERVLLQNASTEISQGKLVLIVGCSGVGKSQLLNALAGLLEDDGPVRWEGDISIGGLPPKHANVGVVFQAFALFDELSPIANVKIARDHRAKASRGNVPDASELLEKLNVPTNVRTSDLSGGQRQRLAIARTLAYDPGVILYDEPTSGLDLVSASAVADMIHDVHTQFNKTSVVVTHDIDAFEHVADEILLFDPLDGKLVPLNFESTTPLHDQLVSTSATTTEHSDQPSLLAKVHRSFTNAAAKTGLIAERVALSPFRLLPFWKSPAWGLRYLLHYLRLVAGPSAWVYLAITGGIVGFVSTYFTFQYLPFAQYTEPLILEELLGSIGFALYRIFVPVLATILIAARCGGAVAADLGGKRYGRQIDAMHTLGLSPGGYLQTNVFAAFLIGTPVLTIISYAMATIASLIVFSTTHAHLGPDFWNLHFFRELTHGSSPWFAGTGWLALKTIACAYGTALITYYVGVARKRASVDVSRGITSTILYSTLFVLAVHFVFAFFEFQ